MTKTDREMRIDIPTNLVERNEDNPRLIFSEEGMLRLIQSIKESGILVPLTVYRKGSRYVILDGERRWKAAKRINLPGVPCYVLPEPTSRMEYILSMFKIHNVREEWKLLPTARKLEQVIDQIKSQTGKERITNRELTTYTSLTPATVGRCIRLLTLPKKYQDMLFEEERLVEKGIKPTKTTLSEDFFLEMLRSISAIESKTNSMCHILEKYPKEKIISIFIDKFKKEEIPDITDFRYLTKLVKQTRLPVKTREKVIIKILKNVDYRIDEAYDIYARPFYESENLEKQLDRIAIILESLQVNSLDYDSATTVLKTLAHFRGILESKIADIEKTLSEEVKPSR